MTEKNIKRIMILISKGLLSSDALVLASKGLLPEEIETIQEIIGDNNITWDNTHEAWDTFCYLWNQCYLIISEINDGGRKQPEEIWNAYKKLNKEKKKKIIKLILYLKDNIIVQEKEIKDYNVTINDIELINEVYKIAKEQKTNINVKITNVDMR